jgi:hypothetical protein
MEVVEGNETGFQWAHNDERDKVACVSKLCENAYNEKNIQKIDDEIYKCQLLCSGCHKVFQTQVRFKKSFEEWDALIARGVNATYVQSSICGEGGGVEYLNNSTSHG